MGILSGLYNRTFWIDNKTKVNAEKLNNIERGISNLYDSSLTSSDIIGGENVDIETTDTGKVKISFKATVMIITEEQETYDRDVIYFLLSQNGIIQKIIINGVASVYGMGQ